MKIGIIGAMAEEIRLLKKELINPTEWQEAGALFISGQIGKHEVVVVQSGIGKTLAALTATLLISHYKVEALINTGSAGGIGDGLAIGDLVISDKLAYFDADVTAFGYKPGQMAGMPLFYEADTRLIRQAETAAQANGLATRTGLIVTGDIFVDNQATIKQIKHNFPDVLANEMEGAAIAHVAHQYKLPFVVIRAMSDVANEDASTNFDEFIIEAGQKSAKMVLALLTSL